MNVFVGVKRKYQLSSDNLTGDVLLKRFRQPNKTLIKVKRIVHASPKADSDKGENEEKVDPSSTETDDKINEPQHNGESISFEDLHKNVRAVKLPTKSWKIKMFMTEKKKPLKIVFTNKEENERCVSFSYCSEDFVISFSGYTVNLLGAPKYVATVEDISILLSIIDKINVIDPVLEYI